MQPHSGAAKEVKNTVEKTSSTKIASFAATYLLKTPKNLFVAILRSAITGWLALMVTYTIYFIRLAHQPGFDPEVGPIGTFIFFFFYFSIGYFAFYSILGLPGLFVLRYLFRDAPVWKRALLGALLAALSVIAYNAKTRDPFVLQELFEAVPFAVISGSAAFSVFPFSFRYEV
jgi:hypothetical protein